MTATGHAVIGVAIAATFSNPIIAIPLAIGSHVLADLFPHWDTGTNRKEKSQSRFFSDSIIDGVTSVIITFLLVEFIFPHTDLLYAYFIVFWAQFFDWATAPYLFLKIKKPPIFYWFYKLQKSFDNKLDKPWGIIGQVSVLAGIIIIAAVI